MNSMKLRMALAMLQSLLDNLPESDLPRGDIAEKYVHLYHKLLGDIQIETNHDLSYFQIPSGELEPRLTVEARDVYGDVHHEPGDELYCDRAMFLISINAAMNFINALTLDAQGLTIKPLKSE